VDVENGLVTGALGQEEDGVGAIIRQNNRRLFRLARSIVRDDNEAEDIVQECYLRAFAGLSEFRGEAQLSTWLTRIVINEAYGRLRRRRVTTELGRLEGMQAMDAEIIPFPLARELDPERSTTQREIRQILERAIDALPEPFRVVLVARLVEEMSIEQTAELLAIRQETVKTRLHRARKLLRDHMEREVGPMFTDLFPFDGK